MAEQLVQNLAGNFDPEKYTDEYRANLMKIIRAKMQGKKVKPATATHQGVQDDKVIDLMDRLRESLKEQKPKRAPARGRKSAKTRKTA